jgi:phenylalanyl-tRNA synthetase beta chain
MRTTTVVSMLGAIATNINKKNENVALYDISRTYKDVEEKIKAGDIPQEDKILTIGMYGENVDFYVLKGIMENVLEAISVNKYDIEKEQENPKYHPGRTANIRVGNDVIATLGEVHPKVAENFGINKRVYVAELNIEKVVKYSRESKKYVEVPKFPAVERDIAVTVDEAVEVGSIERLITKKAKKILENVTLFDIYRDEKLGENKKSVAYSLIFRDKTKTLTDEEINEKMNEIIEALEKEFGAELRK